MEKVVTVRGKTAQALFDKGEWPDGVVCSISFDGGRPVLQFKTSNPDALLLYIEEIKKGV